LNLSYIDGVSSLVEHELLTSLDLKGT
jgi:hypothetical protein